MTLTTFLRQCVYFPLGGGRRGRGRTYLNILLVFLISGLWHGAGWTFLVWGALHGLAQITERAWGQGRSRLPRTVQWAMTFLFVGVAWVFFRAPDLRAAGTLLSTAVSGGWSLSAGMLTEGVLASEVNVLETLLPGLVPQLPLLTLAGLLAAGMAAALWPRNVIGEMEKFVPAGWRAVICAGLLTWSVLSFSGVTTFIYSNF